MNYKNHINGEWLPASDGATFEQRDPADLSRITGLWPQSPAADAAAAIEAAQAAYPAWRALGVFKRAEYLKQALSLMDERREAIAEVITMENGKTLAESLTEIDAAVKEMEFQIHEAIHLCGQTAPTAAEGVFAYQTRVPLGVVSVISPWNFPFNVPGRKCTPALMAGNTVVFKPASLTPRTGEVFTRLMVDAGLPDGVFNFVTGGGSTVGETFTTHPAIKAISFTGSTEVGKRLNQKASANLTRTQLELGGKNPMLILEDADLDQAAAAAATAAFACAGQWCTSTSRVLVPESVAAEVTGRIVAKARALQVGDGRDSATGMGPVCGEDQLRNILEYIEIGRNEGAELLTGGGRMTGGDLAKGCFIEPTVFGGVKNSGFGVPEAGKTGIEFFTEHKVAYVKFR